MAILIAKVQDTGEVLTASRLVMQRFGQGV
jgi:hypothetical protein